MIPMPVSRTGSNARYEKRCLYIAVHCLYIAVHWHISIHGKLLKHTWKMLNYESFDFRARFRRNLQLCYFTWFPTLSMPSPSSLFGMPDKLLSTVALLTWPCNKCHHVSVVARTRVHRDTMRGHIWYVSQAIKMGSIANILAICQSLLVLVCFIKAWLCKVICYSVICVVVTVVAESSVYIKTPLPLTRLVWGSCTLRSNWAGNRFDHARCDFWLYFLDQAWRKQVWGHGFKQFQLKLYRFWTNDQSHLLRPLYNKTSVAKPWGHLVEIVGNNILDWNNGWWNSPPRMWHAGKYCQSDIVNTFSWRIQKSINYFLISRALLLSKLNLSNWNFYVPPTLSVLLKMVWFLFFIILHVLL